MVILQVGSCGTARGTTSHCGTTTLKSGKHITMCWSHRRIFPLISTGIDLRAHTRTGRIISNNWMQRTRVGRSQVTDSRETLKCSRRLLRLPIFLVLNLDKIDLQIPMCLVPGCICLRAHHHPVFRAHCPPEDQSGGPSSSHIADPHQSHKNGCRDDNDWSQDKYHSADAE